MINCKTTVIKTIKMIALLMVYTFIWVSCKNSQENNSSKEEQTIHFNVSDWEKGQKIPGQIIKRLEFIPLETNEKCLMGSIRKIELANNQIFITDRTNNKIFIFDILGKYLGSIGNPGKGPGELVSLKDFIIDESNNQVFILDNSQRKVLIFSLHDHSLKSEFKIEFLANDFKQLDESKLVFYTKIPQSMSGINYSIAIMNLNDKSFKWFLEKDDYDISLSGAYSIFQSQNTYFAPYLKDVVYRITPNQIEPFITFDFGQNKIPIEKMDGMLQNPRKFIDLVEKSGEWTYGIENIYENHQFISFTFHLKNSSTKVIYSKQTGNYFYGNRYKGEFGMFPSTINKTVSGDKFYGAVDSYFYMHLKKRVLEEANEEFKNEYLRAYNKLSEGSNPILFSIEYNIF